MLELFFREAAVLEKYDRRLATEAMDWLNDEDRSMSAVFVRTWKDRNARKQHRMGLRRERIKDWYRKMHNHDQRFEEYLEDVTLEAFRRLEWPERRTRPCTEDADEEKMMMELRYEAYDVFRLLGRIATGARYSLHNEDGWDNLAARLRSGATPIDANRIQGEILRPNYARHGGKNVQLPLTEEPDSTNWSADGSLHLSDHFPIWVTNADGDFVQTSLRENDDCRLEASSTKAKVHGRRKKLLKGYAAIWPGKSRM